MAEDEHRLFYIWEDTVDLKQLLIGLACGGALGFTSYAASFAAFTEHLTSSTPGVIKGYALMGGIVGCVCTAVGLALAVKPKRAFRATAEGPRDRAALIHTLALDPDEERVALEEASPKLIREMQQLQVYDLFVDVSRSQAESER